MQFIRDNLFLVGVGAVLVIGMVILGALYFNASSAYSDALTPLESLSSEIANFKPVEFTSDPKAAIADRQAQLDTIRKSIVKKIAERTGRYDVLKVAGQPAFPLADKFAKSQGMYRSFSEAYLAELDKSLALLHPAVLATKAQYDQCITEKTPIVTDYLAQKAKEAAAASEGNNAAPTAPRAITINPMNPMMAAMNGGVAGAGADANSLTAQSVTYDLQMQQAKSGRIYATITNFDRYWEVPATNQPTPDQLWQAQLNLWVQRDIVDAINLVNQAVLDSNKKDKADPDSVLISGIRGLEKIRVAKQYTTGTAVSGTITQGQSTAGMPPGGFSQMMRPMMPPGAMRPMMPMPMPVANQPQQSTNTDPGSMSSPGFTNRASCKDYDVLQYNFTVVMPAYLVLDLQKALYGLSYHTVLRVEMVPVDDNRAGTTATVAPAGPDGQQSAGIPLYYGPGSFMKVTIYGEFLMPSPWQRGTFDRTQSKWMVSPLVPYEVLADLATKSADALRQEDQQRVTEKNNMQPMPTAAVASPTSR